MPLVKRYIEPSAISRGKVEKEITNELECVSNNTLACVIQQLSSLSKQSEDLFSELYSELYKSATRTNNLMQRIEGLKDKICLLNPTAEQVLLQEINQKKPFKSSVCRDQNLIARSTRPFSVDEVYKLCDSPPQLNKLDVFREDGKDSLKFYTNPEYFVELWVEEIKAAQMPSKKHKHKNSHVQNMTSHRSKTLKTPKNKADEFRHLKQGVEFIEKPRKEKYSLNNNNIQNNNINYPLQVDNNINNINLNNNNYHDINSYHDNVQQYYDYYNNHNNITNNNNNNNNNNAVFDHNLNDTKTLESEMNKNFLLNDPSSHVSTIHHGILNNHNNHRPSEPPPAPPILKTYNNYNNKMNNNNNNNNNENIDVRKSMDENFNNIPIRPPSEFDLPPPPSPPTLYSHENPPSPSSSIPPPPLSSYEDGFQDDSLPPPPPMLGNNQMFKDNSTLNYNENYQNNSSTTNTSTSITGMTNVVTGKSNNEGGEVKGQNVRDSRSDLLSAIREGIKLRKVEEVRIKNEPSKKVPGLLDVQSLMEAAMEIRRGVMEKGADEDEEEEEEDEWSD